MGKTDETLLNQFSRGYVRHWSSLPADTQETALMQAGLTKRQIYREGRGAETLGALVRAIREEQIIGIFGGLRVFGDSRRQIMASLKTIEDRGGIVLDIETGERSDRRGAYMLDRALARIRGELTMGDRASEIGAIGGTARGKAAQKNRMPEKQARKIWLDKTIDTATALSRMGPGWSKATALRMFGGSARPSGPFRGKRK